MRRASAVPGEPGLWVFLLADMTMFAVLFGAVLVTRADEPEMVTRAEAQLHQGLGIANTLLLLCGSLLVALAVRAARDGGQALAARLVTAALLTGVAFVAVKGYEWTDLVADHHTPSTNQAYALYFALTALHLVHVVTGVVVLWLMRARLRAGAAAEGFVEGGGAYWHMVDLLWLVLFPLLYLVG